MRRVQSPFIRQRDTFVAVFEKCKGLCFYCGWPWASIGSQNRLADDRKFVIDHMTPVARGGGDDLANLTLACDVCNSMKSKKSVEEFREFLRLRLYQLLEAAMQVPVGYFPYCMNGPLFQLSEMIRQYEPKFFGERGSAQPQRGRCNWEETTGNNDIKVPELWALQNYQTGRADDLIDRWLEQQPQ